MKKMSGWVHLTITNGDDWKFMIVYVADLEVEHGYADEDAWLDAAFKTASKKLDLDASWAIVGIESSVLGDDYIIIQ